MDSSIGCVPPPAAMSNVSQLLTFLMSVQMAAFDASGQSPTFNSKMYVDMPLRNNLSSTQEAFASLGNGPLSNATVQDFVDRYFSAAGSDLEPVSPHDYIADPPDFLPQVRNPDVRKWALQVHTVWLELTRQVSKSVENEVDQHTLLPLASRTVMPGSIYREVYYWDSYWIIRGLIVSKMYATAQGLVDNLLTLADTYGFVPNGARTYYLNRSQPPLLSEMVKAIFIATGDLRILERAVPILIREHVHWTSAPHTVTIADRRGVKHSLSRYYAQWNNPRPETATTDVQIAQGVSESNRSQLYHEIASTAESGWDFSSRWMEDHANLTTIRTTKIIPVDLNAFVFQLENNIATFGKYLGLTDIETKYAAFADQRRNAVNSVLWDGTSGQWRDYWLPVECEGTDMLYNWDKKYLNKNSYASNFIPLWTGMLHHFDSNKQDTIVTALNNSGLLQAAGIATSTLRSGQEWDYPNAFAPLQSMLIEGLRSSSSTRGKGLAEILAKRWLKATYISHQATGLMHNKYDSETCGASGSGQTGFGWTNGVVLSLLHTFGWLQQENITC